MTDPRTTAGASWRLALVALLMTVAVATDSCSFFDRHVDVLLMGDSLMDQAGPYVEEMLQRQPALADVKVQVSAENGSGLLTPDNYDWRNEGLALARDLEPDVTVILFVGNYTETDLFVDDDGVEIPNDYSQPFFDAWGDEATRLSEGIQATGSRVYWVLPPPFYGEEGARREALLRQAYLDSATEVPGVGLVDGRDALGGVNGEFTWKLPNLDNGEETTVRQFDSLHLTEDGAKLLARQISQELSPVLQEIRQLRAA